MSVQRLACQLHGLMSNVRKVEQTRPLRFSKKLMQIGIGSRRKMSLKGFSCQNFISMVEKFYSSTTFSS